MRYLTDRLSSSKFVSKSLDKFKAQIHRSPDKHFGSAILEDKLKLKGKKSSAKLLKYPESSKIKAKNLAASSEASFSKSFLRAA